MNNQEHQPRGIGAARRIMVIGNCGCGKSTLARQLADMTQLPLIHLDQEFWHPGWVESDKAEFVTHVNRLCQQDAWIIDGNYGNSIETRLARAELVIWLDYQPHIYMTRLIRRIAGSYGRVRPDMAEGCPEKLDLGFLKWAWDWQRLRRPRMLERWQSLPATARGLRFTTPAQTTAWLADWPS